MPDNPGPEPPMVQRWEAILSDERVRKYWAGFETSNSDQITIPYDELATIDFNVADLLVDNFSEQFPLAEAAMCNLIPEESRRYNVGDIKRVRKPRLAIVGLHSTTEAGLSVFMQSSTRWLGVFQPVRGYVKRVSAVMKEPVALVWQCVRCLAYIREPQKEPLECYRDQGGCGKSAASTRFKLCDEPVYDRERGIVGLASEYRNAQELVIQDIPGSAESENPVALKCRVYDENCFKARPGDIVVVNGVLKTKYDMKHSIAEPFFDGNSVEVQPRKYEDLKITPEDEAKIQALARDPDLFTKLVGSVAPSIMGMEQVKQALVLQLFGGRSVNAAGIAERGNLNLLLVGDPGTAKSQLLRSVAKLAQKAVLATGNSSSKAGLTAAVVKEEHFGSTVYAVEAGTVVLADGGIACIDEIEKANEEDVAGLHEAMEQQCYDAETEVLTENGWKLFKDVAQGEKVATLTPEGELQYAVPTAYVTADYDGDMYYIKSRQVNLAVTPNHNMYVNINKRANDWDGFKLIRMDNIPMQRRMRFKKNARWVGTRQETFSIPSAVKYGNQYHAIMDCHAIEIKMNDWLEFLGYYLSEGSVGRNTSTGVPYTVHITQTIPEGVAAITQCLNRLPFSYRYDGHNFTICSKQLAAYLSQFGYSHEKHIPRYVMNLPPEQLRIMLNALVMGDGWVRASGQTGYVTSSKRLADDIIELLLKVGWSGNIYVRQHKGDITTTPRGTKAIVSNDIHIIGFVRDGCNEPNINTNEQNHIHKEHYTGKIYCVEVPHHTLYVRRHGVPIWCGNTVTVNKAGINMTMQARTALLAAANPIAGTFDMNDSIMSQVELQSTLISRFDLIFMVFMPRDDATVTKLAKFMRKRRKGDIPEPPIDVEFFRKYVAYAKRIEPEIDDVAGEKLDEYYREMVALGRADNTLTITGRQFEALERLAEARARLRLSSVADDSDVQAAIDIMRFCLSQYASNGDKPDLSKLYDEESTSQRHRLDSIKEIIGDFGGEGAPCEDIFAALERQGQPRTHATKDLDHMKQRGEVYVMPNGNLKLKSDRPRREHQ